MEQPKRQDNYIALWRGVSAQMVVVGHALNLFFSSRMLAQTADGRLDASRPILYVQSLGVVIFFLISGYIVTKTSLVRAIKSQYDVIDFLIDRGTRILVPFIPAAVLIYAFDHLFFHDGQVLSIQDIHLDLLTLVGNCLMVFSNPILGAIAHVTGKTWLHFGRIGTAQPFWSIVVEWWIYVAYGIVAIHWVVKRKSGWLSLAVFLFALLYPLNILVKNMALPFAWVFGSLYCLAEDKIRALPRFPVLIVAVTSAAMSLVTLYLAHWDVYNGIFTCTFAVAFLLCHRLLDGVLSDGGRRLPKLLNMWSDYSYSLYLVHFSLLVYLWVLWPKDRSPYLAVAVGFTLANVVGYVFWWGIESRYGGFRRYAHGVRDRLRQKSAAPV